MSPCLLSADHGTAISKGEPMLSDVDDHPDLTSEYVRKLKKANDLDPEIEPDLSDVDLPEGNENERDPSEPECEPDLSDVDLWDAYAEPNSEVEPELSDVDLWDEQLKSNQEAEHNNTDLEPDLSDVDLWELPKKHAEHTDTDLEPELSDVDLWESSQTRQQTGNSPCDVEQKIYNVDLSDTNPNNNKPELSYVGINDHREDRRDAIEDMKDCSDKAKGESIAENMNHDKDVEDAIPSEDVLYAPSASAILCPPKPYWIRAIENEISILTPKASLAGPDTQYVINRNPRTRGRRDILSFEPSAIELDTTMSYAPGGTGPIQNQYSYTGQELYNIHLGIGELNFNPEGVTEKLEILIKARDNQHALELQHLTLMETLSNALDEVEDALRQHLE